jgi:CBS domain-containing protein
LFVPSVVVGGCVGRAFGYFMHIYVSDQINPGVYALLGAASMFGGFTRLILPAAVMLVEMTGDSTYLLPIMFCTAVAKVVSDQIQPPLYPQHMAIEGIPTLGDKLNPLIAPLQARHIMQRSFYSVCQLDTLDHILHVLDHSKSMLLPVVSADGQDKFVGMIMRRSVLYALKYTKLYKDQAEFLAETNGASGTGAAGGQGDSAQGGAAGGNVGTVTGGAGSSQRKVGGSMVEVEKAMGDVRNTRRAAADTDTVMGADKFDDKFSKHLVNLTPFMDAGALTAHEDTSAKRIAAIFRRLGISHLGVADHTNKLVGVITRRHLIKAPAVLPPNTPHMAPQQAVQQLLEKEDLDASPDAVLDLASYDPALALEAEAMRPLGVNQSRAARAARSSRRSQSIFAGDYPDPAVRFDDEEDALPLPSAEAPGVLSPDSNQDGEGDDDEDGGAIDITLDHGGSGEQQQLDAEAPDDDLNNTGAAGGNGGGDDLANTGGNSAGASRGGAGPTPRTKAKQSSLSRLNNYTRQV